MKTTSKYPVLILALIFLGAKATFAGFGNDVKSVNDNSPKSVAYHVTIHLPSDAKTNMVYFVEITDAAGTPVAPPQILKNATSAYTFAEVTREVKGIRTARLVLAPFGNHVLRPVYLISTPDVKAIYFNNAMEYPFDLYPKIKISVENSQNETE